MEETKNEQINVPESDIQIKKERKPRTEAQKAAFEKCRLARAERLKVKKESSLAPPSQEVDISPPVQVAEEIQVQSEPLVQSVPEPVIKKQRRPRVKKTPKVPDASDFKVIFY